MAHTSMSCKLLSLAWGLHGQYQEPQIIYQQIDCCVEFLKNVSFNCFLFLLLFDADTDWEPDNSYLQQTQPRS